jgi:hypothetical protein
MTSQPTGRPPTDRDPDLIVARAHLRLGSLGLARAELETMAGRDRLDDEGIRDLAEARWRTGDVTGAGEAASAYLEVVPDDIVALVIAAEAQADLGRPAEARRLAGKAIDRADGSLDPVFAGMKRSAIWPVEPGTAVGPVGVLFDDLHPGPIPSGAAFDRRTTDRHLSTTEPATHAPMDPAIPAAIDHGPGLWDLHPGDANGIGEPIRAADADSLFHGARVALDRGQPAAAATGLILALRAAPHLAPAVLDLLSGRAEPILVLVRGDALRIVGREGEAMRDHASAASRVVGTTAGVAGPAATSSSDADTDDHTGDAGGASVWEAEPSEATDPSSTTEPGEPGEPGDVGETGEAATADLTFDDAQPATPAQEDT